MNLDSRRFVWGAVTGSVFGACTGVILLMILPHSVDKGVLYYGFFALIGLAALIGGRRAQRGA